jgi:hypothetical protein
MCNLGVTSSDDRHPRLLLDQEQSCGNHVISEWTKRQNIHVVTKAVDLVSILLKSRPEPVLNHGITRYS